MGREKTQIGETGGKKPVHPRTLAYAWFLRLLRKFGATQRTRTYTYDEVFAIAIEMYERGHKRGSEKAGS